MAILFLLHQLFLYRSLVPNNLLHPICTIPNYLVFQKEFHPRLSLAVTFPSLSYFPLSVLLFPLLSLSAGQTHYHLPPVVPSAFPLSPSAIYYFVTVVVSCLFLHIIYPHKNHYRYPCSTFHTFPYNILLFYLRNI